MMKLQKFDSFEDLKASSDKRLMEMPKDPDKVKDLLKKLRDAHFNSAQ